MVTDTKYCSAQCIITVEVIDQPQLSANFSELDFGSLSACVSSRIDSIALTNPSPANSVINLAALTAGFALASPPLPIKIKAGESKWLKFRFTPVSEGESQDSAQLFGTPCNLNFTFNINCKPQRQDSAKR
jgi:hypothetical protein